MSQKYLYLPENSAISLLHLYWCFFYLDFLSLSFTFSLISLCLPLSLSHVSVSLSLPLSLSFPLQIWWKAESWAAALVWGSNLRVREAVCKIPIVKAALVLCFGETQAPPELTRARSATAMSRAFSHCVRVLDHY